MRPRRTAEITTSRRSTTPWAIAVFGIALAFLIFRRPPPAEHSPWLNGQADSPAAAVSVDGDRAPDADDEDAMSQAVFWLITEVNNGGFHQYFHNMSGDQAVETAEILRTIGAHETANLVETGCGLFPDGKPPPATDVRRAQLAEFSADRLQTLQSLDRRFYARRENLNLLLRTYRAAHPAPAAR